MTRTWRKLVLVSVLITIGLGCNASVAPRPASSRPFELNVWGLFDDVDDYETVFRAYQAAHPNITINYRKFRLDEYEKEVVNALAEDRGPDVMMVHNTWMRAWQPKLLPAPRTLTLSYREVQGTVKKETVWVEKTTAGPTPTDTQNRFVDQVAADAVISAATDRPEAGLVPQVFALPMWMDTMVLYYNRDVLNAAGVPTPAQNWAELQDHVKRITKYDDQGKLVRPAVGLGAAKNIDRAFDIISLLMMQNGAQMTDQNGYPTFNQFPPGLENREVAPGTEALVFYTDFANPTKEVFTWDDTQPNSFDAFVSGKTAYFFGYNYHLPSIRAQAPKLNLGITTVPQIDPNVKKNYANYWLYGASKKSGHPNEAWALIQFMTAEAQAKSYLAATAKPTALRSLIPAQLNEADLAPFASQALTAKSWYRGINIQASEDAFADMVQAVLSGREPQPAVSFAASTINQTIRD